MLLAACGGDTQVADTPIPETTVAAKVEVEPSSTKEPPKPESTNPPMPTQVAPPTPTPWPTTASTPEPTPARIPSEWPDDVGTSHFGHLAGGPREAPDLAGVWIRPHPGPFVWGLVEPRKGQYYWGEIDRQVRLWQERRLAVLVTIWPFAEWDQQACHTDQPQVQATTGKKAFPTLGQWRYSPCDEEAYAAWLSAAVERYDGDGVDDMPGLQYPLRYWEILNEPEMQGPELTFFQEDSAAYLELLKLSYTTIKAADPNTVVLPGGQAGMQSVFVAYWEPVLQGGGDFFDVGNIHSIGSDDEFFASEYRALLDSLSYAEKPYWITEAGIPTRPRPGESPATEDDLAKMVLPSFATAFGEGAGVIIKIHQGSRPGTAAYETYLLMARTVGEFTVATRLAKNAVRFEMPDGRTVYVLWDNAQLPSEVTGTVTVVTYAGEESQEDANSVAGQVPILVIVE